MRRRQWAATQNNFGAVLWMLREREVGTARLEDAVAAHRAALTEWTRERVPLDWAASTGHQGVALNRVRHSQSCHLVEHSAFDGGRDPLILNGQRRAPLLRHYPGQETDRPDHEEAMMTIDLHFICRQGLNWRRVEGVVYETGDWANISKGTADAAVGGRVYLHEAQADPAWHGGTITAWRPAEEAGRKIFTYVVDQLFRVLCPGPWGREKAIVRR